MTSRNAYKQWIRYWRDVFLAGSIEVPASGAVVEVTSPDFAEALQQTSRGNFVIADAGKVLDEVSTGELPAVADQLFAELVEASPGEAKVAAEVRGDDLDTVADRLLDRLNLRSRRNFHRDYPVRCMVNGVEEEYVFSDAFANGSPQRLYRACSSPKAKPV